MDSKVVAIIFSKNRALQLQAILDSFFLNCKDSEEANIVVFYKVEGQTHVLQYQALKGMFKQVTFIEETKLVKQLIHEAKKYEYVLLQVDDTIYTNSFSLSEIKIALEKNKNAIGFSLRLGSNTPYCYMKDRNQRIPEFLQVNDNVVKYQWNKAQFDFAYPLEVSSSVYRTKDVLPIWLNHSHVEMPRIEDTMNKNRNQFVDTFPYLLCYKQSVAFSNPMNGVSILPKGWTNTVWGDKRFSVDAFTKIFASGYKIDVGKLVGFVSNSCHQEVELTFVK